MAVRGYWFGAPVVLALAFTGGALAAPTAQPAPLKFRKGPYVQDVRAGSVRILGELSRAAPLTVSVTVADAIGPGVPIKVSSPAATVHEVVIPGLSASTRYAYRVEAEGLAGGSEFVTAPPVGVDEPFTFVVFGDSREDNAAHRAVVERILSDAPDFALNTGDLVGLGSREHEWQTFFDVEAPLLAGTPFYPALGNHDYGAGGDKSVFRRIFAVPSEGPDGEAYYRFDWGASRFLVLDSNGQNKARDVQRDWLERELQAARADAKVRHVFVSMHHPPFSISVHGGDERLQRAWAPLFTKYRVDAVFSGHDHVYQRLVHDGVLYVVSGGGGASLYTRGAAKKPDKNASVLFERVHHYVRVQVRGDAVELSAIRDDGSLIETLRVGGDGAARARPVVAAAPGAALVAPAPAVVAAAAPQVTPAAAAPAAKTSHGGGACDVATGSRTPGFVGSMTMIAIAVTILLRLRKRRAAGL